MSEEKIVTGGADSEVEQLKEKLKMREIWAVAASVALLVVILLVMCSSLGRQVSNTQARLGDAISQQSDNQLIEKLVKENRALQQALQTKGAPVPTDQRQDIVIRVDPNSVGKIFELFNRQAVPGMAIQPNVIAPRPPHPPFTGKPHAIIAPNGKPMPCPFAKKGPRPEEDGK